MDRSQNRYVRFMIPAIIMILCFVSRLMCAGHSLEGWDDVDFALALYDYDLTAYQPHFPGYFLYVAVARGCLALLGDDIAALILPNIVFGSCAVIPIYFLAEKMFSRPAAILASLLYVINPLCWLQCERPLPDVSSMFFALLALQFGYFSIKESGRSTRRAVFAGWAMGAALGFKPSYFSFMATWLAILWMMFQNAPLNRRKRQILYSVGAFIAAICFWLVPMLWVTGFAAFFVEGYNFTAGHFTDWGGSTATETDVVWRAKEFYQNLFANGLGAWSPGAGFLTLASSLAVGAVIFLDMPLFSYIASKFQKERPAIFDAQNAPAATKRKRLSRQDTVFLIAAVLPYLIWLFLGQNLSNARHALPLTPILLILISACVVNIKARVISFQAIRLIACGLIIINFSVLSFNLISEFKSSLPPHLRLINYVKNNADINKTRVYCMETKRLFDYYAPEWDARRVRNLVDLEYDLQSSATMPELTLCVSEIEGLDKFKGNITILGVFEHDKRLNNSRRTLSLCKIEPVFDRDVSIAHNHKQ